MSDLVHFTNGFVLVSSKEIAERFGKTHRHVLESIKAISCSDEFRSANFRLSSYTTPQNKILPCYDITRDGFAFLCMGFTGSKAAEWKEKYINAFNKMESIVKRDAHEISLTESLNIVSLRLDDIKKAGSIWGKNGAEIRRHKKTAIEQLYQLLEKAQLQLGFDLV